MSAEYNEYLNEHIMNVNRAYDWLRTNLREIANPTGIFNNFYIWNDMMSLSTVVKNTTLTTHTSMVL